MTYFCSAVDVRIAVNEQSNHVKTTPFTSDV